MLDKDQILNIIPHRVPFLWIDRVVELEVGSRCVALKFIDPAEAFFAGHFPGNAILPGVIIIEAAAQTAAVMLGSAGEHLYPIGKEPARDPTHLLAAVNRFKFLKPVKPGCELRIETKKINELGSMAYVEAKAWIGNEEVARGELAVVSGRAKCPEAGSLESSAVRHAIES